MRDLDDLTFAVVGATGAVGREMVTVLAERGLPVGELKCLASERSKGEVIEFGETEVVVEALNADSFAEVDIALFSAGSAVSAEYGKIAADAGAVVIDNSSYFRMHNEVPLVVPEVNAHEVRKALALRGERGAIIANPNCSTIQLVVVLKPIMDRVGLRRVVVSTYQSVSGAGKKGMDELMEQTVALFNQQEFENKVFPHRIAFNILPQIDVFLEDGYTKEEWKVINESKKILGQADLAITATAARVPVFSCHSESVNIQTERPIEIEELRKLLTDSPGVVLLDDPAQLLYPMSAELTGTDATYVGRLRRDPSAENAFNMWIVADNLRKGAALNAVQIAEVVIDAWGAH